MPDRPSCCRRGKWYFQPSGRGRKELCGRQLILRRSYFSFLPQEAQDNFASLRVTKRKHVRANGAEPIVNDMVGVLGGAWGSSPSRAFPFQFCQCLLFILRRELHTRVFQAFLEPL